MSDQTQTVFVTKYALTDGIREVPLISTAPDGSYVVVKWGDSGWNNGQQLFHGNDFHETAAAAKGRAEAMRAAKIASHEKSIAKLKTLAFA